MPTDLAWATDGLDLQPRMKLTAKELSALRDDHPLPTAERASDFVDGLRKKAPPFLSDAVTGLLRAIIKSENLLFPERIDPGEDARVTRARLLSTRVRMALDELTEIFERLRLPDLAGTPIATVPLASLIHNPHAYLNDVFFRIAQTGADAPAFPSMSPQLIKNSRRGENRYENPVDSKEPPDQLIRMFFKGTPFLDFFETRVPFAISTEDRLAHTHVLAPTKTGKTRTLLHLIYQDVTSEHPPAVVVVEPKNELVRPLSKLRELQNRLLIVDQALTPPLNIFKLNSMSEDAAIQQYGYAFKASDMDMGTGQELAMRRIARVIVRRGGNLSDFKRLLAETCKLDASHYRKDIYRMDDDTVVWFDRVFFGSRFDPSKQALLNKIEIICDASTRLDSMLSAEENAVDIAARLNTPGSVTLINTGGETDDASEFLGRWFIAQVMAAAKRRTNWTKQRCLAKPIFLYVDEAQTYFSSDMTKILNECRSLGLGLILSHQNLAQFDDPSLRKTVLDAPYTRIARPGSQDRSDIIDCMNTTPAHLASLKTIPKHFSEFAIAVRDVTNSALTIAFPHTTVEDADCLSEQEYEALFERSKWKLPPKPKRLFGEPDAKEPGHEGTTEKHGAQRKASAAMRQTTSATKPQKPPNTKKVEHTEPTDW